MNTNERNKIEKFGMTANVCSAVLAVCLYFFSFSAFAQVNVSCYAKAMPKIGHGGQAWNDDLNVAKSMAMDYCRKNSQQTGGDPKTCRITQTVCKKK